MLLKEDGYLSPHMLTLKGLEGSPIENCLDSVFDNTKLFDSAFIKKCRAPLLLNLSYKRDVTLNR